MKRESPSPSEREKIERQLGRRLRGEVRVAARCPHGEVSVIATAPVLEDGTPFPTLFWLTCPLLRRLVSGLESGDFRLRLRRMMDEEPGFASGLSRAEADYAAAREQWAEEMGSLQKVREYFGGREGIGGTVPGGIKCLHAHLAHFLAGGDNPVGERVRDELGDQWEEGCGGECQPFLKEEGRWTEN